MDGKAEPTYYPEAMAGPRAAEKKETMKNKIQSMWDNQV